MLKVNKSTGIAFEAPVSEVSNTTQVSIGRCVQQKKCMSSLFAMGWVYRLPAREMKMTCKGEYVLLLSYFIERTVAVGDTTVALYVERCARVCIAHELHCCSFLFRTMQRTDKRELAPIRWHPGIPRSQIARHLSWCAITIYQNSAYLRLDGCFN